MSETLIAAAGGALGATVVSSSSVGGGDINRAWRLDLEDGGRAFLKSRRDAPEDEFGAEAAGLEWLRDAGGLQVPEVLAVIDEGGERGLVLEWVEGGRLGSEGEEELGRGLATIHRAGADGFNALPPGSPRRRLRFGGVEVPVGSEPPENHPGGEKAASRRASEPSWPEIYAGRLSALPLVALKQRRIDEATANAVERVTDRLDDLAGPPEPPARIHGDLWSGNVHAGADARPWLIDPAAHGAHREMDLAMLDLFGSVAPRTIAAYEDVWPLESGWRERLGLWQLQPLLVHAILFGGSYGSAVARIARSYA